MEALVGTNADHDGVGGEGLRSGGGDCCEIDAVLHAADAGGGHAEGEEAAFDFVAGERVVDPGGVSAGGNALEAPALHAEGEFVDEAVAGALLRIGLAVVNPGDPLCARALLEGERRDDVAEVVADRGDDIGPRQLGGAEAPKERGDEIAPEAEWTAGFVVKEK